MRCLNCGTIVLPPRVLVGKEEPLLMDPESITRRVNISDLAMKLSNAPEFKLEMPEAVKEAITDGRKFLGMNYIGDDTFVMSFGPIGSGLASADEIEALARSLKGGA